MSYYNRGTAYSTMHEYDKAIADFTEAIKLDPKNHYSYNNRGVAYYDNKNYSQAYQDYS